MISSLPIFILTAAKLAAPPVANRPAMPIDCRNTNSRAGQRIDLTCFSRLVVHHSDFDVLIPSHSRIGKLSGGTRISMLLGTPG